MANDLTVPFSASVFPETCCAQRDQMQEQKTFPAGSTLAFAVFGSPLLVC